MERNEGVGEDEDDVGGNYRQTDGQTEREREI
jgi:hypothetical protein